MAKKLTTAQKARKLWIAALRSGKYWHGKKALHPSDNKFCCLGVLCEVAVKAGVISSYLPHNAGVPTTVREWVGLRTSFGNSSGNIVELTTINDDAARNPFQKIANIIESEPEGLFV